MNRTNANVHLFLPSQQHHCTSLTSVATCDWADELQTCCVSSKENIKWPLKHGLNKYQANTLGSEALSINFQISKCETVVLFWEVWPKGEAELNTMSKPPSAQGTSVAWTCGQHTGLTVGRERCGLRSKGERVRVLIHLCTPPSPLCIPPLAGKSLITLELNFV